MDNSTLPSKVQGKEPKPRYELTLAEFPISLLSKRGGQRDILEYKDTIDVKGKKVERIWRVIPSAKYGICGPTTQDTLFELIQLWREQGFQGRNINFGSIYKLIERKLLRSKSDQNYKTVAKDLDRLVHTTFDAINAFYDTKKKAYVDVKGFRLFDYVALYKDSPTGQAALPFSYIRTSELLWKSANQQSFFPLNISRELFHSLAPLEQRIALYLDKMFRSQHTVKRDLFKLAEQLPIQSTSKKKIKQTIKNTCEGLIRKGYGGLDSYDFEKSVDGKSENAIFYRAGNLSLPFERKQPKRGKPNRGVGDPIKELGLAMEMVEALGDEENKAFYKLIAQKMPPDIIYRALSEIRQEARESGIRNKGAVFTIKIKRSAQELGIDLGLKESS